jgi:hypothetical protein
MKKYLGLLGLLASCGQPPVGCQTDNDCATELGRVCSENECVDVGDVGNGVCDIDENRSDLDFTGLYQIVNFDDFYSCTDKGEPTWVEGEYFSMTTHNNGGTDIWNHEGTSDISEFDAELILNHCYIPTVSGNHLYIVDGANLALEVIKCDERMLLIDYYNPSDRNREPVTCQATLQQLSDVPAYVQEIDCYRR